MRRAKLAALAEYTKRPAVLYATDFLSENKMRHAQNGMSINAQDVRGLAEVVRGLEGDAVDLILHSPGGSVEPVESMVTVLRFSFQARARSCARNGKKRGDNDCLGRQRNLDAG